MTGAPKNIWMFCITINTKAAATLFYKTLHKILPTSYFGYFGYVWPLPSKTIMLTWRNFDVYLYAKKWNPSLTSFLRYCKLVTLSTLRMFDHANQYDSITLQETLMFTCMQKPTSYLTYFIYLGTLGMLDHPYQKSCYQFVGKFHAYLHAKNQLDYSLLS